MAGTLLKKTFTMIFGPVHVLTRLFQGFDDSQTDLESQSMNFHSLIADDRFISRPGKSSDGPERSSNVSLADSNSDPALTGPTEGPSRVFVHRDGAERCLGILVTDDMVSITQDIINKIQIVREHQKKHDDIEKEILYAQEMTGKARVKLEESDPEEAQKFQDYIDMQESNVQDAYGRRDALGRRLEIFKTDLNFAREASHFLLTQTLEEANLVELPPAESEEKAVSPPLEQGHTTPETDSVASDPEEMCREAAMDDAILQLDNRAKTEREFDERRNFYHDQLNAFREAVARGDSPNAQSDFDRQFVAYGQDITRRLIDADETYKRARMHAIALGAMESDWGEPTPLGPLGEWEAQSLPVDEYAAYQASHDWSTVEAWIQDLPTSEYYDPESHIDEEWVSACGYHDSESPVDEDSVDIDDWDARLYDVWESVSVYDCVESSREKIDRWEAIREQSRAE